jgi:N-acyl-D-aspartate/D-glutamate deacylase
MASVRTTTFEQLAVSLRPRGQIAGSGRWLMPGLADMHVHTWRDDDLTMFVAAGVTTIRNRTHCPVTWVQAGSTPGA